MFPPVNFPLWALKLMLGFVVGPADADPGPLADSL